MLKKLNMWLDIKNLIKSQWNNKVHRVIWLCVLLTCFFEIFHGNQTDEFVRYLFMNVFAKIIDAITNDPSFTHAIALSATGAVGYLIKCIINWFKNK